MSGQTSYDDTTSTYSYIYLDTRNSNGDYNYDTYWQLPHVQSNQPGDKELSLHQCIFPNVVYPINEYNNIVRFRETDTSLASTTTWEVVLSENFYTGSQLASAVESAMNAVSIFGVAAYNVVYDSQSVKLNFTLTGTSAANDTFQFEDSTNSLLEDMGVLVNPSTLRSPLTLGAGTQTYIGEAPVNISGTQFVDVITNISTNNYTSISASNILARIPVNVEFGGEIFFQPPQEEFQSVSSQSLNEIYVQLRDDNGNFYKLPNNAHFSMVLRLKSSNFQ
jgi:hypothetical protein